MRSPERANFELKPAPKLVSFVPHLAAGTHFNAEHGLYYRVDNAGQVRWVINAKCDHAGGTLYPNTDGNRLKCPRHGWALDIYKNDDKQPRYDNGLPKSTLRFDFAPAMLRTGLPSTDAGLLVELPGDELPWRGLLPAYGDKGFKVTWLNHASLFIEIGGLKILTDPWFIGPAFHTGWWLKYPTPMAAIELAQTADLIYISHEHPDHLHEETLRLFGLIDKKFIVPHFSGNDVGNRVTTRLFQNGVNTVEGLDCKLGQPVPYILNRGSGLWGAMLRTGNQQLDSALMLVHGDNCLVIGSDCSAMNNWVLPKDISFLATSFAGGATAHPSCFIGLTKEQKAQEQERKLAAVRQHVTEHVAAMKPGIYMPYAGHFVEAPVLDPDVWACNEKNTMRQAMQAAKDGAQLPPEYEPENVMPSNATLGFDAAGHLMTTENKIDSAHVLQTPARSNYVKLQSLQKWDARLVAQYMLSSKHKQNLFVIVIPCGDYQIPNGDSILLHEDAVVCDCANDEPDCLPPAAALATYWAPEKRRPGFNYLLLWTRAGAMMTNARRGLPLDELLIGFQCRIEEVGGFNGAYINAMSTNMRPA